MPAELLVGSPTQLRDSAALSAAVSQFDRVLGTVLELTPAIVRVVDVSGRIVRTNEQAFSASSASLPRTIRELWERDKPHRAQEESVLAFLDMPSMRALGGVASRRVRLVIGGRVPGESVVIERSAVPVLDDEGKVIGAVVVDQVVGSAKPQIAASTQRQMVEASSQQLAGITLADNASTTASRAPSEPTATGLSASALIHDINNDLNTIMGAVFLAQGRTDSPDAIRDYTERIQKAAESAAQSVAVVSRIMRAASKSDEGVENRGVAETPVATASAESSSSEDSRKTGPLDILLVEDNPDGREFIGRLLRKAGHRVDAVATAAEARARLDRMSSSQVVDLLLTDLDLPDGNGWELASYARRQRASLRVGVISGWDVDIGGKEVADAEFVLRKPLRAATLLDHVAGRQTRALPE